MKIPLQEKIAQLEQRIIALEETVRRMPKQAKVVVMSPETVAYNNHGWKTIWEAFDRIVKRTFKQR